jgi:hypothetical protein
MIELPKPERTLDIKELERARELPLAVSINSNGKTAVYIVDVQKTGDFFSSVGSAIDVMGPSKEKMEEALKKYGKEIKESVLTDSVGFPAEMHYSSNFSFEMYRVKL